MPRWDTSSASRKLNTLWAATRHVGKSRAAFETRVCYGRWLEPNKQRQPTIRPKGCGLVTFSAAVGAAKAITMLHSTDLDGRPISVRKAHVPSVGGSRNEGNGHHDGLGGLVDESTTQYGELDGIGNGGGEHNGELGGFEDYGNEHCDEDGPEDGPRQQP